MRNAAVTVLSGAWLAVAVSASASAETTDRRSIDQIVVSASATEEALRDAPAALSRIDRDSLLERPVRDALDAVRETPGITLTGAGFTRQRVNIRGMDSTHTLFLVDGRRVSASADLIAHSDFELGWIPTEAIDRIEVVRGPLSALYGSEALGGVVNVITLPVTREWSGSASTSWGEPSGSGGREYQVSAQAGGPLVPERLGMRVYVNRDSRAETPDRTDLALSAIEGRRSTAGGATFSWTPADLHRVDVSLRRAEDRRERNTRTGGPPQTAVDYTFRDDIARQQVDAHYTGDFSVATLELGAYRSRVHRRNDRTMGQTPSDPQRLVDDIAEARVRFDAGDYHSLLLGGELRREKLDDDGFVDSGNEDVQIRALYLQDRIAIPFGDLALTVGARMDDHQRFGTEVSPRAYLVWHATPTLTLRGGYGEGFKAPTLKQLSPQYSAIGGGGRFEIVGNPELQPETSRSLELGVLSQYNGLRAEATVFQNRLRDLVQTECFDNCGVFGQERRSYINVAEARIRGLETGAGVELPWGFDLSANYTYLDARDREADARLADRPRHSATGRLGWAQERWSAHLRAQRVGSQLRLAQGQRLDVPHYTLWHVGAAVALNDRLTLRTGVENLTNERLAERSERFDREERGRFAYVGMNLSL